MVESRERQRRNRWLALAAVAALVFALFIFVRMNGGPESAREFDAPLPSVSPTPSRSARPKPSPSPTAATNPLGGPVAGIGLPNGLSGEGGTLELPRHDISMSASSDREVRWVSYWVPTAREPNTGLSKYVKRFAKSAVAYGKPDYAQLWVYGAQKTEFVECTIRVDGKVTSHERAEGPWAIVFCQG